MHLVDRLHELSPDPSVVIVCELDHLFLSSLIAVETVLKGERVGDLKLLPRDDPARTDFIRLNFEPTVSDVEHMCLLSKDAGQQAHDRPAKEPAVRRGVTPVEKRILLLGMAMDIAVNPDLPSFDLGKVFEHLLGVINLGLEFLLWGDPLAIQIEADSAVTIVTANNSVRVEAWDQDEGVKLSQEPSLFAIRYEKVKGPLEDLAGGRLSRVDARGDHNNWLLLVFLCLA